MVSCRIGIFFRSISRPTPEASAISHKAPKIPPSVTSCMADTPTFMATLASSTTLRRSAKDLAVSTSSDGSFSFRSCSFSDATMALPSKPIHLVTTSSCPGFRPDVATNSPFFTLPTPVTDTRGWFTTADTSVCPPMISTP